MMIKSIQEFTPNLFDFYDFKQLNKIKPPIPKKQNQRKTRKKARRRVR